MDFSCQTSQPQNLGKFDSGVLPDRDHSYNTTNWEGLDSNSCDSSDTATAAKVLLSFNQEIVRHDKSSAGGNTDFNPSQRTFKSVGTETDLNSVCDKKTLVGLLQWALSLCTQDNTTSNSTQTVPETDFISFQSKFHDQDVVGEPDNDLSLKVSNVRSLTQSDVSVQAIQDRTEGNTKDEPVFERKCDTDVQNLSNRVKVFQLYALPNITNLKVLPQVPVINQKSENSDNNIAKKRKLKGKESSNKQIKVKSDKPVPLRPKPPTFIFHNYGECGTQSSPTNAPSIPSPCEPPEKSTAEANTSPNEGTPKIESVFSLQLIPADKAENITYVCKSCGEQFKKKFLLDIHLRSHALSGEVATSNAANTTMPSATGMKFICGQCGKVFRDKRFLDIHMHTHAKSQVWHQIQARVAARAKAANDKQKPSLTEDKATPCAETPVKDTIQNEKLISPKTEADEPTGNEVSCDKCGKLFKDKRFLDVHLLCTHLEDENNEAANSTELTEDGSEKLLYKIPCEKCGKLFKERRFLVDHMYLHAEEEDNMVETEPGGSISKRPRIACNVCFKQFKEQCYLDVHMVSHLELEPEVPMDDDSPSTPIEGGVACERCGKEFKEQRLLDLHMRLHNEDRPFPCKICDKRFTQRGNLARHMLIHLKLKPYECSICKRRFRQKAYLREHMNFHSGEKPYQCPKCDSRFTFHGTLRKHLTRIHKRPEGEQMEDQHNDENSLGATSLGDEEEQLLKDENEVNQSSNAMDQTRTRDQSPSTKDESAIPKGQSSSTSDQSLIQNFSTGVQSSSTMDQSPTIKVQSSSTKVQTPRTRVSSLPTRDQSLSTRDRNSSTRDQSSSTRDQSSSTRDQSSSTRDQSSITTEQSSGKVNHAKLITDVKIKQEPKERIEQSKGVGNSPDVCSRKSSSTVISKSS
ncbi:transcription factor E4F1 [Nematostella vectensis]|uniref:transcription factor E4F1 n=1 Tax=Nematostella vectensis TaxID=45351 RepID=UPI002077152D|nr:transcription factor E4F1 [Nematostella vectensis]